MAEVHDKPPTTHPRHLLQNSKAHLSRHVEHEANGKDSVKRLALQRERLAVTLDQCRRNPAAIGGAVFTPGRAHHLKRDIGADKLQLSLHQPREESPCPTG